MILRSTRVSSDSTVSTAKPMKSGEREFFSRSDNRDIRDIAEGRGDERGALNDRNGGNAKSFWMELGQRSGSNHSFGVSLYQCRGTALAYVPIEHNLYPLPPPTHTHTHTHARARARAHAHARAPHTPPPPPSSPPRQRRLHKTTLPPFAARSPRRRRSAQ